MNDKSAVYPRLNNLWTIGCLFAVVAQFAVVRGFHPALILLFGVPTAIAALHSLSPLPSRGRFLANLFLGLIGFGIAIAHVPRLFPDLGDMNANLPLAQRRILMWYLGVYLIYALGVVPFHVFTKALAQHKAGEPAAFSRFTCYLGLFTALLLLPGMIGITVRFLHIWPVYR